MCARRVASPESGSRTRPSITLDVYSHEFAAVQHRDTIAAQLTGAFGGILDAAGI